MSTPQNEIPATLVEAMSRFQADLPKILKDETAKVEGKEGKQGYSYKYADLADVSEVVLRRLGALGVAYIAKPTVNGDGKFGLSYALVHVSGGREDGFFPLRSDLPPQQTGGLITYARRYCLCAITGVAPDRDDDGASAQSMTRQPAYDNGVRSQPARPAGQVARPAQQASADASLEADPDAQVFADEAHEARTLIELEGITRRAREARKLTAVVNRPGTTVVGGKLAIYLDWCRKQLKAVEDALGELNTAADKTGMSGEDVDEFVKQACGTDLESATPDQLREAAALIRDRKPAAA